MALACLCLAGGARAEGMPGSDPTRPPALLAAPRAEALAAEEPVLQFVLLSKGRKTAIISGEQVELGGKFGEARLTELRAVVAVLDGPGGRTTLNLLPEEIERKPSAPLQGFGSETTGSPESSSLTSKARGHFR